MGGKLRHRLRVERATRSRDPHGGSSLAWTLVDERWGDVQMVSASEYRDSRLADATITHRVTMRYMPELDSGAANSYRMIWTNRDDRVLNVVGVRDVDGKKRGLEVDCVEAA